MIPIMVLAVMWTATGNAQVSTTHNKKFTIDDCITTALTNNPDVRRSEHDIDRSLTYKQQAFGSFLPTLSGSASWTRLDQDIFQQRGDSYTASRNSYNYSVQSSLLLFDGMNNFITADRSILNQKAAENDLVRSRQDIRFNVHQKFYNCMRLKQLINTNQANLERSQKQLARIRELNAVGSVPKADVYRQEVQAGRDELTLLQSQNDYVNALVDLQAYLGLDPADEFAIDDSSVPPEPGAQEMVQFRTGLGDFQSLVRTALEHRADFQSSKTTLEYTRKGVSSARSAHYPTLRAFAEYTWNNNELAGFNQYDRFGYGLSLEIPVFAGFQTSSAVERAELDYLDKKNTTSQLERTIAAGIRTALNALNNAEKNLEIARRTLASAREDQRVANERYTVGAGTLLDLIVANSNLMSAEADVINANFSYLTARKQVEYQLGNI
jgi:outer membrane protein